MSLALSPAFGSAAEEQSGNRVLLIYSSSDVGEWEQLFNSEILRQFSVDDGNELVPEFLSLIRSSEEQRALMAESLLLRYGDYPVDLVISVFPEAATFAKQWSSLFAPDASLLYVLPGTDILDNIPSLNNDEFILQSAVTVATRNTLQLMHRVIPDLQKIYVVGGSGQGDLSYANRIARVAEESDVIDKLQFVQGLLADELVEELSTAPDASAILMSQFDINRLGQPQRSVLINSILEERVPIPVFALFDTQIGRGSVGGNMSATDQYAIGTANIARDILAGRSVPTINDAPTLNLFDGEQLNKFNINRSLLPAGSIIRNDPPNFFRENLSWLVAGSMVIIAQLALIALLARAINERRKTEEALKTTQKAEALGSLAGGIAHDFNNILMAIMANAELAKSSLTEPQKAGARLSNIISASTRAKGLISQVLLFSRQAAAQSFDSVGVKALLEESIEQIRAFLPADCSIQLNCEDDLPPVSVDNNQLHQAILNLCINAQHAMNNEGDISISARMEDITEEKKIFQQEIPPGSYVSIEVRDTGIGIDKENQQHIFEPFFTTKPQGKGTGLGLALVYRIVKAHEGFIDLDSAPGKGTSITIYLKASEQPEQKTPQLSRSSTLQGHGERILLVDDDDMVLDATARMLEKLNYEVMPFRSSLKALEEFRKDPGQWDLVFTDLSMPEMDGARLGAQLRQVRSDIDIILYTGYLDAVDAIDLENLRILSKPSRIDEIATAVATTLAQPSPAF